MLRCQARPVRDSSLAPFRGRNGLGLRLAFLGRQLRGLGLVLGFGPLRASRVFVVAPLNGFPELVISEDKLPVLVAEAVELGEEDLIDTWQVMNLFVPANS